ncbi:MAG: carboxypeptidase regulatory-like domain-containing protein [Planctomycetes bacterium]|nr:carboxypeptidase regulatory-like domain-containing protein [Planctomycetota bacterium]
MRSLSLRTYLILAAVLLGVATLVHLVLRRSELPQSIESIMEQTRVSEVRSRTEDLIDRRSTGGSEKATDVVTPLDSGREWKILVVDEYDNAVSGASVRVCETSRVAMVELPLTGLDGATAYRGSLDDPAQVIVSAKGYSTRQSLLSAKYSPNPLVVRLLSMARITGRVVDWQGGPVAGVRVLAVESGSTMSPLSTLSLIGGKLDLSGMSNDQGEFSIDGAAVQTSYRLLAGGNGWVSRNAMTYHPGDGPLEIVAFPIYLAVIEFDAPFLGDGGNLWGAISWSEKEVLDAIHDHPGDEALAVCGLPPTLLGRSSWPYLRILKLSKHEAAQNGFVRIKSRWPGCKPIAADVPLRRLGSEYVIAKMHLEDTSEGRGSARIELTGLPSSVPLPVFRENPAASLQFASGAERFEVPVSELRRPTIVSGIPRGSYRVLFLAQDNQVVLPRAGVHIEIVPNEESTVQLDLSRLGNLLLHVRGADGLEHTGMCTVQLERRGLAPENYVYQDRFWMLPYFAACLREGSYQVVVKNDRGHQGEIELSVLPGVMTEAMVLLK